MIQINENEFKIKVENSYPYYLYCIRWSSQPRYVKVGYGNKYRLCSSSYSTPFGSDGQVKIWIPKQDIDKTSMHSIEQQLHLFLIETKRCTRGNKGGREVYKIEFAMICFYIEEFIENQMTMQYEKFETTISNYKKNFKPKAEDYIVFAYNLLSNVNNINCIFCNRRCSNHIYECLCLCDNEKTEIYVGSTCFKKLNHTYIKTSTVTVSNYKLNKIINPQFENEQEEQKQLPILISSLIDKDDVIDCYIKRIENNGSKEKSYIEKTHMNHIEAYLMNNICHYIFINNYDKTFKITIDNKFIEQYNLTDILNIFTIYGLLYNSKSKYIILYPLNLELQKFEIDFNHPKVNSTYITNYFSEYRNDHIFNYIETTDEVQKLTLEQVKSLESTIPYISGFPGTGKSRICKYIVEKNRDKKILIITPTYSTRQSLAGEFESGEYNNILPVVIASIYDKKLIIDKFNPDIILVDEYGMIDIIGWYKIMNICDTFNRPILKIFGDPYQLPPIDFVDETRPIIKQMYTISNKLTFNFRSINCPDQYNYLIENKAQYNINDIKSMFEVVPYNKETILSLRSYILLAGRNTSVNKINQIVYDSIKVDCIYCPTEPTRNQIHLTNKYNITYIFCDKCINKYEFIITSNINCTKSKKKNEILLPHGKMHSQYQYKIYPKEPNNRGDLYSYYSENREKIFYNGEMIKIKLGTKHFNKKYYDITTRTITGIKTVVVFDIESLFKKCINLPYAQTIHKSQGQTIEKVAIIMDSTNIMSSLLYTAFTRARDLKSIKILFPDNIQVSITRNDFDDIINESIKCTNCNSICKLKITSFNSSYPNRNYWGCLYSKICGGGIVKWLEDESESKVENDIDLQLKTLKIDFDIEEQIDKLVIKLKEGKKNVYQKFFKDRNIKGYLGRKWIVSLNSSLIINELIEHSILFGGDNQYEN